VILKIEYESGEGPEHRKFTVEAFHMDPAPDTIAPMIGYLMDILTRHPEDVWHIVPLHLPPEAGKVKYACSDGHRHGVHELGRAR
jgi:hypothetical protein